MKILTYITAIFLIFGLLGAPNGVFAQDSSTESNTVLQHSDSSFLTNNFIPLLKGGSKSSHVSKKIHDGDDDDNDDSGSTDDGSGWWIAIIIIIIIAIIILAVWYFFLRK